MALRLRPLLMLGINHLPVANYDRSNSPSSVPTEIQLIPGLPAHNDHSHVHSHEGNEQTNSGNNSQRNSPNGEKSGKNLKEQLIEKNSVTDVSSPPVQTLIFENTNYSKTTKAGPSDLTVKTKFPNHMKTQQQRVEKRGDLEEEGNTSSMLQQQSQQQQTLPVAFSNKPNDLMKDKNQDPIQMPLSFNKNEDNADMKLDFTFDSDLSQLTDEKNKTLGMTRSIHAYRYRSEHYFPFYRRTQLKNRIGEESLGKRPSYADSGRTRRWECRQ